MLLALPLIGTVLAQAPPPIINGDTTSDYPQVVTLYSADSRGYGYNFCSGTLIAPTWVLSAAHCVLAFDDNERSGLPNHFVVVGYDLSSNNGIQEYADVKAWHAHPDYDPNRLDSTTDMGIIELRTALSIDFMPVNKNSINNSNIGEEYRYIGWGITSDNGQDSSKKRYADMPLNDYNNYVMIGYDPRDSQNVCQGDSGGAVLEMLGNGVYELAGVNSYVTPQCENGATGGSRVDRVISWIEQYTPVYSAAEMDEADADSDTDSDTDSDADSDPGSDGNGDPAELDDPSRPAELGENYSSESAFCAAAPGSIFLLPGLIGLAALRRRNP